MSGIRQTGAGTDRQWVLEGVGGEAAYHDTREEVAAAAEHSELCRADVLMVTDASCTFESWHRASAGRDYNYFPPYASPASFLSCALLDTLISSKGDANGIT